MQRKRRGGSVNTTVTLSALAAVGMILGKFLAFNVTEFMRFSLENITILFTGIVFGPLLGAALGAVQDIVGCIAVGYTINPIITIGSAATGLISGYVYRTVKRTSPPIRIAISVLLAHAAGSVVIKSAGLAIFYSLPFGVTVMWRILNYAIVGAAETALLYFLLKSKQLLSQINRITNFSLVSFKSVDEAASYARGVSGVFSKPGLERVEELLKQVESPERELKVVHVAGTNGKGSFSAFLGAILKRSGLSVGSFNSPYLHEMRESIRINGKPISEAELVSLFERLRTHADEMTDKPTEFELLTAAAYLAFYEARVDVCVVECGMGGGKDATNVIDSPLLSVITGIAIDHTSYLGTTLAEIAREKAGIIKRTRPTLLGEMPDEAREVITAKAEELESAISTSAGSFAVKSESLDGSVMECKGVGEVKIPLLGKYQPKNAALAIRAALILSEHFPTVTPDSIRRGVAEAEWRGRFEILSREPLFIFDGAHNMDGITAAVDSIATYLGTGVIVITGVLADKEYEAMAEKIATVASHAVTVTPASPRALSATEYARVLTEHGVSAHSADSTKGGVEMALKLSNETSKPIVCLGSLYLYREISEALKNTLNTHFDN